MGTSTHLQTIQPNIDIARETFYRIVADAISLTPFRQIQQTFHPETA